MSTAKYRAMESLSGWIEYKLKTEKLDPPVFRCRLRPLTGFNAWDSMRPGEKSLRMGRATQEAAIEAVAEWDLDVEGVLIPITEENKAGWLIPIIDAPVEGRESWILLGIAIVQDAQKAENFLKNLQPSSTGSAT